MGAVPKDFHLFVLVPGIEEFTGFVKLCPGLEVGTCPCRHLLFRVPLSCKALKFRVVVFRLWVFRVLDFTL